MQFDTYSRCGSPREVFERDSSCGVVCGDYVVTRDTLIHKLNWLSTVWVLYALSWSLAPDTISHVVAARNARRFTVRRRENMRVVALLAVRSVVTAVRTTRKFYRTTLTAWLCLRENWCFNFVEAVVAVKTIKIVLLTCISAQSCAVE